MSVEQTTQLIQLILNSVLMLATCGLVLCGLMVRHTTISSRLQALNRDYYDLFNHHFRLGSLSSSTAAEQQLFHLKKQLRQLQQRYRIANTSLVAVHYAFLFFIISTFILSCRTVFDWAWLIPASMVLFIVGVVVLLLSVILMLLDFHTADRSSWDDLHSSLSLDQSNPTPVGRSLRARRTHLLQRLSPGTSLLPNVSGSNIRIG